VVRAPIRRAREHPALAARARRVLAWQLGAILLLFLLSTPTVLRGASYAWQHEVPAQAHRGNRVRAFGLSDDESGIHLELGKSKAKRGDEMRYPGVDFLRAYAPWFVPFWVGLLALYGSWLIVETIVCALSRDYSDEVADQIARQAGLDADPALRPPRIRINFKRLWRKLLSEMGAFLVLASGAPFFLVEQNIPYVGRYAYGATVASWGFYWLLVSTAAKSDRSWKMKDAPQPWFLRFWDRLVAATPRPLRWIPRGYGRIWARVTRSMNGAAAITEAAPMYVVGLVLVRVAGKIPIASLVLRPLLPVAADLSPVPTPRQALCPEMGPQPSA
jgi:hypothetical protein